MSRTKYVILLIITFMLGWSINDLSIYITDSQVPLGSGNDIPSPNDWISEQQTTILPNYVLLKIPNATAVKYASTKSMDPVLDDTSIGLEIRPDKNKLRVGDIISYKSDLLGVVIVHRIISINEDEYGAYYITKGDNNKVSDVEKVRFEQIKGVVVGLLY